MAKKPKVKPRPQLVKRTGERVMPKTDVQKFLEEEQERSARKQEMIDAILMDRDEKMKEYDDQLKLLGYKEMPAPKGKGTRQRDPNKPCPVCGELGHDARKHRADNLKKKKTG